MAEISLGRLKRRAAALTAPLELPFSTRSFRSSDSTNRLMRFTHFRRSIIASEIADCCFTSRFCILHHLRWCRTSDFRGGVNCDPKIRTMQVCKKGRSYARLKIKLRRISAARGSDLLRTTRSRAALCAYAIWHGRHNGARGVTAGLERRGYNLTLEHSAA